MGGMAIHKATEDSTEAEAKTFIAENEPLLERATPATLHRIILHGGAIGERLNAEVAAAMEEKSRALNAAADAINDSETPAARIQELEEERMRVQAASLESTKQATAEALSEVILRAITLRQERELAEPAIVENYDPDHKDVWVSVPAEQPRRGFWRRLFWRG